MTVDTNPAIMVGQPMVTYLASQLSHGTAPNEIAGEVIHIPSANVRAEPYRFVAPEPVRLGIVRGNGRVIINGKELQFLSGQILYLPAAAEACFTKLFQDLLLLVLPEQIFS